MSDETKVVTEASNAIREVAKTSSKAIDTVEKLGAFVAPFVTGSLKQAAGMAEDKLRYMRWERQVRYMERVQQKMEKLGESAPTKTIPLNFAIPIFQAASLEEDDYLQDMWANLLVNASIEHQGVELRRAYIDILERLSPLEVSMLQTIYSLPEDQLKRNGILTKDLPRTAHIEGAINETELVQPSEEIIMALANLARLGCVTLPTAWNGGEIFTIVYPTVMGRSLVKACSIDE